MHSIHAIGEANNVRAKVRKLKATIDGTTFPEKSFKVNTIAKLIGVMVVLIVVLFMVPFLLFSWLQLSATTLLIIGITLLILVEIVTTTAYNRYHGEIGSEISKIKQMTDTGELELVSSDQPKK
jgi:hypothetical protein